jgi:hypothetical protein
MKRIINTVVVTILMTTASFAVSPKPGTFGLGWYSPSAPVGGRVWVNETIALDLGLGFADKNALASTDSRLHVNIGIPVTVVTTERVNFFIRPGVELQTNSRVVGTEVKSTTIITADLGAEWFVTDQFSLTAGHGLQFAQVNGSDDWGITALRALSVDNVGFHFYFNQ